MRHGVLIALVLLLSLPIGHGSLAAAGDAQRTIDWLELMPEHERQALESLSEISHEGTGPAYSFTSDATVPAMDGVQGRIAAFVVPLAHDEEGRITELFLVPYFGACVHMPAPPPNQIIHAVPSEPLPPSDFWDPLWAVGTLKISRTRTELADAAYRMELDGLKTIDLSEFQGTE